MFAKLLVILKMIAHEFSKFRDDHGYHPSKGLKEKKSGKKYHTRREPLTLLNKQWHS